MPSSKADPRPATTELSLAPWDSNTWDDIEEELAAVSPTVRVQWSAARAQIQTEERRFVPPRGPWQRMLAPPGIALRNTFSWAAYGKPRSLITLFDRPWSPPAPTRDENAATPWNVKAPRLSPRVAAAKFDFGADCDSEHSKRGSEGSKKTYADAVLKIEEQTGGDSGHEAEAC